MLPLTLRQIDADALPALQAMYEASTGYFRSHAGEAAGPAQAAFAYGDVLERGDRALLGVWWQRERLIGCFDLRLNHPEPGVAWFGALILSDELPADRTEIASLSTRILEAWLRIGPEMNEIRLAVLLSDRSLVQFWTDLDYEPTSHALRQNIHSRRERFVVYRKQLLPASP